MDNPRDMQLDWLKCFVAVVDTGTLSSAASEVFRSQSAVSMQIKKLEDAMGHRLLDRSSRRLQLTPEGQTLLGYARRMLDLQAEAQQIMRESGVQMESWGPFAEGKNGIFQNPALLSVARKHGKTTAQVILRWLTQREVVVIPKTVRKERMMENFSVFDFDLSPGEMEAIRALDTHQSLFIDHRDPAIVRRFGGTKLNI